MSDINNGCENKEAEVVKEESFAMEVLKENKKNSKRWFVAAMVELGIIVAIIAGALYFLLTTEISYTELSTEGGGNANCVIDSEIGDINNNGKGESGEIITQE